MLSHPSFLSLVAHTILAQKAVLDRLFSVLDSRLSRGSTSATKRSLSNTRDVVDLWLALRAVEVTQRSILLGA
jgi:hypothetical protein